MLSKIYKVFPFFAFLITILLIMTWYIWGSQSWGLHLFNSDAFYLPVLFKDVLSGSGHFTDWYLTPAPYFFPDYLMFFFCYVIGTNAYQQILLFALLQIALIFLLSYQLLKLWKVHQASYVAALMVSILCHFAMTGIYPFIFLYSSAFHVGTLISIFIVLILWKIMPQTMNRRAGEVMMIAAVISFATALSDALFIFQLTIPFLIANVILCLVERKSIYLKGAFSLAIGLSSIIGLLSYTHVVSHPSRAPAGTLFLHFFDKLEKVFMLYTTHPFVGFTILCCHAICGYHVLMWSLRKYSAIPHSVDIPLFTILSLISSVVSQVTLGNLEVSDRYFIATDTLPFFVAVPLLAGKARGITKFAFPTALTASLMVTSLFCYKILRKNPPELELYPTDIACIDEFLKEHDLHRGVTGYWQAKSFQALSKSNVQMSQYFNNFNPLLHITSERYYGGHYDFAIVSKKEMDAPDMRIDRDALLEMNGEPNWTKKCGQLEVISFGVGKLRMERSLSDAGDTSTWKACRLPTVVGRHGPSCDTEANSTAVSGVLTFGPYMALTPGHYKFSIVYSSQNPSTDVVGSWDVMFPQIGKYLVRGNINGSNSVIKSIEGNFDVGQADAGQRFEVHTVFQTGNELSVKELVVTHETN